MSWEELPARARRVRTAWAIKIAKNGITVWLPEGHRLGAQKVKTFIGKGEERGMLRLVPDPDGRAVNVIKSGKGKFIRYATLPFAPRLLPLTEIRAIDNADSSTDLVLPWTAATRSVAA